MGAWEVEGMRVSRWGLQVGGCSLMEIGLLYTRRGDLLTSGAYLQSLMQLDAKICGMKR